MTSTLGGHDPTRRVKEGQEWRQMVGCEQTETERDKQTERSQRHIRTQPGTQRHRPSEDPEPGGGRREAVSPGAAGCSRWLAQRGAGRRGQRKTGMGGDLSGRAAAGGGPRPLPSTEACSSGGTRPQASKGRWRLQGEHRRGGRCPGCHTPLSEKAGRSCTQRSRANLHLGDTPWWAERAKEDAVPLRSG